MDSLIDRGSCIMYNQLGSKRMQIKRTMIVFIMCQSHLMCQPLRDIIENTNISSETQIEVDKYYIISPILG